MKKAIVVLVSLVAVPLFAATINVPSDYTTLADALAAANDGDAIQIADGIYQPTAPVLVAKAVEIVGNDADPSQVVFDGQSTYKLVSVSNDAAFIHGISFVNGKGNTTAILSGYPSYFYGCSFEMNAGTLSNCVVRGGSNTYNGCLSLWGTAKVLDSTISDGRATGNSIGARGGCIQMGGNSVVRGCLISGGSCTQGGGVSVEGKSLLADCTVSNCTAGGDGGGGINVHDSGAIVSNCVVHSNTTKNLAADGGGARIKNGTVYNSLFYGNSARNGGGVRLEGGKMINCTVASNSAVAYEGVYQSGGQLISSLVAGKGTDGLYKTGGTATYSCAETLTSGTGNIGEDPASMLHDPANGDFTLFSSSPCIDAGSSNYDWGADAKDVSGATARVLDGDGDGTAVVDIGAFEYDPSSTEVHLAITPITTSSSIGNPTTILFRPAIDGAYGDILSVGWDFGDGESAAPTTLGPQSHDYVAPGSYTTTLTVETTVAGTLVKAVTVSVKPLVVYLAPGVAGVSPYNTPEKATCDLAAAFGALGVPTEGGARAVFADGTYNAPAERILILDPVEIAGNDDDVSAVTIDGTVNGEPKRPFFQLLNDGAFVHGITFYRGWIGTVATYKAAQYSIAPLEARHGVISNCVVESCCGDWSGGTVIWDTGKMIDCGVFNCKTLGGNGSNASQGGGIELYGNALVSGCVITNCSAVNGGGVGLFGGTLENSVIFANTSRTGTGSLGGGGVYIHDGSTGVMRNCLVYGNKVPSGNYKGGGVYFTGKANAKATVENCTIVSNKVDNSASGIYMGAGTVRNCIVLGEGEYDAENPPLVTTGGTVIYTCSPSLAAENGNISAAPVFKDAANGDYRVKGESPTVDAGTNAEWMASARDLGGAPRIAHKIVDMGCYEALAPEPLRLMVR